MAPLQQEVVPPNCKYTSWDYWFVVQEIKSKASYRSEFNLQLYRELTKMALLRHGVAIWIIGA